jgi:hypothetical protein
MRSRTTSPKTRGRPGNVPEIITDMTGSRYDPVVTDIAPSSICEEIFVRAYAEPKLGKNKRPSDPWQARERPESWFDSEFLVVDTETVDHRLTFGAYERYKRGSCIERAAFCADDLPKLQPTDFAKLQAICKRLGVRLYLLANVFSSHIWRMRRSGSTFVFYNASYDLSRLATSWRPAAASGKRNARFVNGFEFIRSFETWKDRNGRLLIGPDGRLRSRIVEQPFVRIRRDDRHHVRYDMARANVLDLATLTHTLTDKTYTLQGACEAFGIEFAERPGEHDGTITEENVAGCLYDVAKTGELLFAAGAEYDRHPIDLPPWRAQSGASLAKAYLRAFGVSPRSVVQPDFSKEHQGIAATTYFGGRVEARIVGEPMPCTNLDAVSMYPAIFELLNIWFDQVIPARLEPEQLDPFEVQRLLDELGENPRLLLDRNVWPRLAFFALVDPNGANLPTRPTVPSPHAGDSGAHRLVTIGPVSSSKALWYAGPDLAAAVISGSERPCVLKAWRLRPEGVQQGLQPVDFRGVEKDRIDPCVTNPFRRLIELRKRKTGNKLDDDLRSTGYKVIANSGAYGVFVETTPQDIDPDVQRATTPAHVWGVDEFLASVDRPERHSPLCSFPIAALVTSGARLLLAIAQKLVHDAGGEVAYCDTDSLFIVSTKRGGLAPCANGPWLLPDGRRAVRALAWADIDGILNDLAALNVYKLDGSSFKIEDENFIDDHERREVWFYGTREKSYCLFVIGDSGMPVPVKTSAHTIGQYRSPYPIDRERRWINEAWQHAICEVLGVTMETPPWFALSATSQLTLTTRKLMDHYRRTCNPFDFLAVGQLAFPGLLRCCGAPRPSCPLYRDREKWAEQPWRCLSCGVPIDPYLADTSQSIFKTYQRVVANLAHSVELKRLCADGTEPAPLAMLGLTIPRPVQVMSIEHMGKEVIVDPTDTPEELTAEQLSATDPVIYRDACKTYDALRARIRAAGISRIAREARVSRSIVKAFLNQGAIPHSSTIAKLEAVLERLGT